MKLPTKRPHTTVIAAVADLHINSTVALCPPRVALDDGGEYVASRSQRWLWEHWLEFWQKAEDKAKEHKADLVAIINGDAMEGQHHGITQIISANKADQHKMALAVVDKPMAQRCKWMIWVRGTGTHVGPGAFTEELLAADFDNTEWCNKERATWEQWYGEVEGVTFHVKHFRRQARLPWTMGGPANRLAAKLAYQFSQRKTHPQVVLRAHGHKADSSSIAHRIEAGIEVWFMPAWKLVDEYVNRIDDGEPFSHIGGLLVTCCAGEYEIKPVMPKVEEEKPWRRD